MAYWRTDPWVAQCHTDLEPDGTLFTVSLRVKHLLIWLGLLHEFVITVDLSMMINYDKIMTMKPLASAVSQFLKHVCLLIIVYPGCSLPSFVQLNVVGH